MAGHLALVVVSLRKNIVAYKPGSQKRHAESLEYHSGHFACRTGCEFLGDLGACHLTKNHRAPWN